jgi:hypothetical protein
MNYKQLTNITVQCRLCLARVAPSDRARVSNAQLRVLQWRIRGKTGGGKWPVMV